MPPPLSVKRTPTFSELIEGGAPVAAPATSPARLPPPTGAPTFADLIGGAATPSPQGSVAPSPQAGPAPIAPELPLPPADDPGKIPPLQVYSDVADVLPNLGVSFFESPGEPWEPQAWKQSFGDVSRAYRILHEQGPHALNEEYNATSTPHLERTAPYNPWSRAELKYPAVRAGTSFASETVNPSNVLLPLGVGLAGKGLGALAGAARTIPRVAKAADAVGDFVVGPFDRFRGVRKVGGEEGEHVAREMVGNTAKAATEALDKAHSVFGPVRQAEKPGFMGHVQRVRGALWPHSYLSREEKIEIVRRSQGLVPKHVVNKNIPVDVPPARRFTLPNANPSEKDALGYLRQAGYAEEDAQQLVNDAARNPKREQFGPTIARAANAQLQKTRQADVAASKAAAMTDAEQARDALLTERAKALRTTLKGMDWKQINAHPELLAADRVFDPEKFFPMAGQYRDKNLTDEAAQFLEDRRPVGGGGSLKTVKGTAGGTVHKTHMDMDDALRGGNLKADFDPAQSLYAFLARRGKNVAFEEGIQKLPDSLAKRVEYERSSLGAGQSNIQQYLKIGDFTHWGPLAEKKFAQATAGMHKVTPPDHFGAKAVQDVLGSSPSAAQRTFHPEAVKFIQEAGATKPEADNVTKFIEAINNLTRIGIITNPVVHVGWNLFGNYLGAKGDPARLGYIASGKGWSEAGKWEKLSDQYGGQAHFTPQGIAGGEVARLATGGGNPVERFGTRLWSANQRFVFDTFEKRFAAALMHDKFQEAQKAGMQEVDALRHAGIEVRKALGDYANVHPAGIEGFLNRALFFYPWLHTIIPFSVKTAANNPSWITKPQRAVQSWNQGMGAPDATKSNQISLGFDDNGNPRMLPLPFVQRNLENVYNVVGPGQGTPTDRTKAFLDVLGTHATPPLSALIDAAATNFAKPTAPGQGNYHILWDKAAPAPEQWRQGAVNFGARFVPPMLKNVPSFASVLGGTPYTRLSPGRARVSAKERDTMLRLINLANKAHNPEAAAAIYKAYTEQVQPAIQGR